MIFFLVFILKKHTTTTDVIYIYFFLLLLFFEIDDWLSFFDENVIHVQIICCGSLEQEAILITKV